MKLNYEDNGHGFPIILIHGLSDDLRLWDPLIPELSKYNRVIAVDLRGHGKSEKPEGPYSIEQFAEDILNTLLDLEISEAHFIALSMGGAILQFLAHNYPQMVKSMVLMSSFCYIDPYLKDNSLNFVNL